MIYKKSKKQKGFVAIFAVLVSAIVLAITLGIASVAYKEVFLSSQARDANFAFFAADTGAECALYGDLQRGAFNVTGNVDPANSFTCAGSNINSSLFELSDFSGVVETCARVKVQKDVLIDSDGVGPNPAQSHTVVESLGYNVGCNVDIISNPERVVERAIRVSYPNPIP